MLKSVSLAVPSLENGGSGEQRVFYLTFPTIDSTGQHDGTIVTMLARLD